MTLYSLVLAGIRRVPRRYLGLALLLSLGGAVITTGTVVGSVVSAQATATLDHGNALRTITVYNDAEPLTESVFQQIRALRDVDVAQPVISVPVGLEPQRVSLTLLPWNSAAPVPLTAGSVPASGLRAMAIAIPSAADDTSLEDLLGTVATVTYTVSKTATSGTTATLEARVEAITDPTYQVDAPNAAYAPMDTVLQLAAARVGVPKDQYLAGQGYERILVIATSAADVEPLLEELQSLGVHAVSQRQQLGSVPGVILLIRLVSSILLAALLVVGGIAVAAVAQGICQARRRDIGVLQAFGWSTRRLRAVLTAEMAVICLAAQLAGTLLGLAASPLLEHRLQQAVADAGLGEAPIPAATLLIGNLGVLIFFCLVVWLVMGRAARQPVMSILRSL